MISVILSGCIQPALRKLNSYTYFLTSLENTQLSFGSDPDTQLARDVKTHNYMLEFEIDKNYKLVTTNFFNEGKDPYQLRNLTVEQVERVVPWYQKKYCRI